VCFDLLDGRVGSVDVNHLGVGVDCNGVGVNCIDVGGLGLAPIGRVGIGITDVVLASGAVEDSRADFIGIQFGRLGDVGLVSRVDGIGVNGVVNCVVNGHGLLSDCLLFIR